MLLLTNIWFSCLKGGDNMKKKIMTILVVVSMALGFTVTQVHAETVYTPTVVDPGGGGR
jgi:hypothetical protein